MPKMANLFQVDLNEPKVVLLDEAAYERMYFVVVELVDIFDLAVAVVDVTFKLDCANVASN